MLIGEIEKNATERIRVSTTNFKGHDYIDVRVFYEDDKGEWRPTKKGITIRPDNVDEIIELVKKAKGKLGNK